MWSVLDDELVEGVVAAQTHLRPARLARLLDASDWDGAVAEITRACQLWGGVADLLVPVMDGVAPDPYPRLLFESELDGCTGVRVTDVAPSLANAPYHRRTPALLALATTERDRLKEMEVCEVVPDDPWALAYLTALGVLPETPDPSQLNALLLRPELSFDDVVRLRRVTAVLPDAADLVIRLTDTVVFTPIGMALYRLRSRPAQPMQSALDGWLYDRQAFARQNGGSIVVVYSLSSVPDLCLTWNLRALHGWPSGLPLAVPAADDTATTADRIHKLLLGAGTGIVGWPILLTSATIDADVLGGVAVALAERDQSADVVDPRDVLRPSHPPARTASATVAFEAGAAIVATRNERDRKDLSQLTRLRISPDMRLTIKLPQHPLPPVRSLNWHNTRFEGGGCVVDADEDKLAELRWPAGFTLLRAVVGQAGVEAAPSASGRTAVALLHALGSLHDVVWLAYRPLLELLYRKAASSGMSWWKDRAAEQAAIVAHAAADPEGTLDRLLSAIDDVSVSHGGESAATITFGELCQTIGGKPAAAAWLEWAERRALLIRGATVKCSRCQHEGWRPLAEIAPPIMCPGCRSDNERPFAETAMQFTYRLGEALRRAIENDSIHHLFTMRTLAYLLHDGPDKMVGAHPGVDFSRGGEKAEADVVVLLSSGAVVPAEVKARSTGLRDHDLAQLELLAAWLDSTTVILATGDDDKQLSPTFVAAAREDALPVRRLLTADDWLDPQPIVTFGTRFPGPDACQSDTSVAPRHKTAGDHDATFAARLVKQAPLDTTRDPTAADLGITS